MFDILALIAAIALIVAVHLLRTLLALPFPRLRARIVAARAPIAYAAAFEDAERRLVQLGFEPARWLVVERVDGEPASMPLRACFVHRDSGGLAWLAPPSNTTQPHRLFVYYSHRLADGRTAISQPFDPYFELTQTSEVIARTLAIEALDAQWQAHLDWIAELGDAAPQAIDDATLLDDVIGLIERQREALLQRGALRAVTPDLAVPRLGFALTLLGGVRRAPKPPIDTRPIAPDQLAWMASEVDAARHRAPPRAAQWLLFGCSVALFMALGAVFWDLRMAAVILFVVLLHESGHFLAMRMFGYRNVHMLALPLIGGVALGIDAQPAAGRRAWMSLMGPLPGIVLGWALLAALLAQQAPASTHDWIVPLILTLLGINYLNVLPVPPLDGAHVVQALLPLRWQRLHTAFVVVAALAGALLAWHFELWVLTILAVLQLLATPARWRLHSAEDELARDAILPKLHRNAQRQRILDVLERHLGPARVPHAKARIEQALQVQAHLQTRPMGFAVRTATAVVYGALLFVPAAMLWAYFDTLPQAASADAAFERMQQQRTAFEQQAHTIDLPALLGDLSGLDPLPAAATAAEIDAAAARLGAPLPDELGALYAVANGVPAIGIVPLQELAPVGGRIVELIGDAKAYEIGVEGANGWEVVSVPRATVQQWWVLAGDEYGYVLYLPHAAAVLGERRVILHGEGSGSFRSVHDWLSQQWAAHRWQMQWEADLQQREAAAAVALADADVDELLQIFADRAEATDLLQRLMIALYARDDAQGAAEDAIAAAETRIGQSLPADHRALLQRHDGLRHLQLLPSALLTTVDDWRTRSTVSLAEAYVDAGGEAIDDAALSSCVVIAALTDRDHAVVRPTVLWCPPGTSLSGVVDVADGRRHAGFMAWLRQRAAQRQAARMQ